MHQAQVDVHRRFRLMPNRAWATFGSLAIAVAAYIIATATERTAIRLADASAGQLIWISDVVLAVTVGLVTFLWLNLRAVRTSLIELEREQIVLDTELTVAADIQRRLLPPPPVFGSGLLCAARLKPAGRIGGDFYDFWQPAPGSLLVLVGDISGKGIPAALLQASSRASFRMLARDTRDPSVLLARLSRALYEDNHGSPYLTCLLASFDLQNGTFTYSNAGHPPGVLIHGDERRTLTAGGPPAGMFPTSDYGTETLRLDWWDVGVIVTDGVTEAIDPDGSHSTAVIEQTVGRLQRPVTPDRVCDAVMKLAADRSGPVDGWQDDQTVVVFMRELTPSPDRRRGGRTMPYPHA